MKKLVLSSLFFILALLLVACSNDENKTTEEQSPVKKEQLTIFTTVYPIQYFTEQIGQEHVQVESIYPPGTDEHTFEPTQKEMMKLSDADYLFYVGLGLEGFVERSKKQLNDQNVQTIAFGELIDPEALHEGHDHEEEDHDHHDHAHGEFDPHIWISPILAGQMVEEITEQLTKALPAHADQFKKNAEALTIKLKGLDEDFHHMAHDVKRDTFFVSHAAFGYLADSYHLNQVAIAGLNSQSEPSQKQLAELVEQAKEQQIHTILFEQNISSNVAEVIQKDIGAKSAVLHNLATLTEEDIANQEDYFSLMERNLAVLKAALNDE